MNDIAALRSELDTIDAEWVELLARRFALTVQVAEHKKALGLPAVDPAREQLQFERISVLAETAGLDPDFARRVLRVIIDEVVQRHKLIIGAPAEA